MGYYKDTKISQHIESSTVNYTAGNLAFEEIFTGVGESTFGVSAIQVFHTADQDCTVYIDQSTDSTFGDDTKTFTTDFETFANCACVRTVASVAPYYRLRVQNTDPSETTTTKLETATGKTPIISVLPAELSPQGNLQVVSSIRGDENYDRHVWVSPTGTLGMNKTVRLVGTNFDGTVKDTNFWTETVTGTGAVAQTGEIKLTTGVTADSTTEYESVQSARFVVGSALFLSGAFKFNDALVTDNIRRLGAYDDDDGFFFELDGSTFNVGSRKATADTLVASGSFNGNLGPHFTPDPTKYYKMDIEWTPLGAFYYINNSLLHKSLGGHLTRKLSLPIRFENNNTNGQTTSVVMDCLGVVIQRLGEMATNPTYKYLAGVTSGVLKYGAGKLHRLAVADSSGNAEIYDGTDDTGDMIAEVDLSTGTLEFGVPFSTGLYVETTSGTNLTVIYE